MLDFKLNKSDAEFMKFFIVDTKTKMFSKVAGCIDLVYSMLFGFKLNYVIKTLHLPALDIVVVNI